MIQYDILNIDLMKTSLLTKVFSLTFFFICWISTSYAESIYLENFAISVSNPQGSSILSARWGVWNGSSFTQSVTTSLNNGYVDVSGNEAIVSLSQTDNTIYTQGTQFALAIFTNGSPDAQALNWSGATFATVLTDSSWLVPAFSNSAAVITYNVGSSTSAVLGSYNFNSNSPIIGLSAVSAVPEPATYAALFGIASLGFCILRKRRKA